MVSQKSRDSAWIGNHHSRRMNYWLVKSEPEAYSWATFVKEGRTDWTGVRNFTARNNLRAMRRGDLVFFYHSVEGKEIVGVARVDKEAFADPTASEGDWAAVSLVPVKALKEPVTLAAMKVDKALKDLKLLRQSRLSVSPVRKGEFERWMELGKTEV